MLSVTAPRLFLLFSLLPLSKTWNNFINRCIHTEQQWSPAWDGVKPRLEQRMCFHWQDTHRVSGAMMRSAISQIDMSMKLGLIHFSFICEPSIISSHQSKIGCTPETMLFFNDHAVKIRNTQNTHFWLYKYECKV